MDDSLVARWREGDTTATTAVRNHVRTAAERVLTHPALRAAEGSGGRALQRNDERRRELTGVIAREVMQRPQASAAQLDAMALMVSARHAVEAAREGRTRSPGAHLPSHTVVTVSLSPTVLPAAARSAAEHHLAECASCAADAQMVAALVRGGAAGEEHEPDPEPEAEAGSDEHAEAMAAALAEVEAQEASPTDVPARPTAPRPGVIRPAPARKSAGFKPLLPLIFFAGVGIWLFARPGERALTLAEIDATAALADRTAPRLPAGLPEDVEAARIALDRDDCRTAAARLRTARMRSPDLTALWTAEAAAFVCAGEGQDAVVALDGLAATGYPGDVETDWLRAQALLVVGDRAAAAEALENVARRDLGRAAAANAQLDRLRALDD